MIDKEQYRYLTSLIAWTYKFVYLYSSESWMAWKT